jgi:hypothetical protein
MRRERKGELDDDDDEQREKNTSLRFFDDE